MSTVGKVLSVLVVLVAVVWIMLAASVAEINRNGTKSVEGLRAEVAKLETAVAAAEHDIQAAKDDQHQEEAVTQNDLTVRQIRQSDAERALADAREINSRVKLQLEGVESMIKSSNTLRDERNAEKTAEIKAKADSEAVVQQLQQQNADLLKQLADLRNRFTTTLQQNKGMVERLRKNGAPTPKAATNTTPRLTAPVR